MRARCFGTDRSVMARLIAAGCALAAAALVAAAPAFGAQCGGSYPGFLAQMERDAQAAGISAQVIASATAGLSADQTVLSFDRRQRGMFHSKSFEEYARTRVIPARINRARKLMQQHAAPAGAHRAPVRRAARRCSWRSGP